MFSPRPLALLHLTALLLLAYGCEGSPRRDDSSGGAAFRVADDAGRTVTLPSSPRRILALMPSVNETLVAMGAADRIVARTDYDTSPELMHLPSVGGGLLPSVETVRALAPDLVIAWPDATTRSLIPRLEAIGVPVYAARVETMADAYRTTERIGRLLGMAARADSLNEAIRRRLEEEHRRVADRPAPRVLYLISLDPPMSAAEGTSPAEVLRLAGGASAFGDAHVGAQQLSTEAILARDPDIVLVSGSISDADMLRRLRRMPGWRDLRAVRSGSVHVLDPNLFTRPGPAAPRAVHELASILHPELDR